MDDFNIIDQNAGASLPELTEEERELWRAKSKGDTTARNELVEKYIGIVEANANNVIETIVAAIEENDLSQAGMIGFLQAIKDYDVDGDVRFEDFSSLLIRDAIIEELNNFLRE